MKQFLFSVLMLSVVAQFGHAVDEVIGTVPIEVRVSPLPLIALKVGDWVRFEGPQAARMERVQVTKQLTVVEKTDDHVIVERHTINQTAKTVPPDKKTIWNSWKGGSERLQFDLKQDYAAWSLFVDAQNDSPRDYSQTVRQPRNRDLSKAEEIKVVQSTMRTAGKDWTCGHYVFKARSFEKIMRENEEPIEIKTIDSFEEWRQENIPFGLLRAKCDLGGLLLMYDMTLIDYGNTKTLITNP